MISQYNHNLFNNHKMSISIFSQVVRDMLRRQWIWDRIEREISIIC
jgi:hypothetical protein